MVSASPGEYSAATTSSFWLSLIKTTLWSPTFNSGFVFVIDFLVERRQGTA